MAEGELLFVSLVRCEGWADDAKAVLFGNSFHSGGRLIRLPTHKAEEFFHPRCRLVHDHQSCIPITYFYERVGCSSRNEK